MRTTPAQDQMLAYYLEVERKVPRKERMSRTRHNQIVLRGLIDKGLLTRIGFNYGPIFALSDVGRVEAEKALVRVTAEREAYRARLNAPKCPTRYTMDAHEGGLCNCVSRTARA